MKKVCVMGLGYIGLPTASVLAANGFEVVGVDVRPRVVDTVNSGNIHIEEPGLRTIVRGASVPIFWFLPCLLDQVYLAKLDQHPLCARPTYGQRSSASPISPVRECCKTCFNDNHLMTHGPIASASISDCVNARAYTLKPSMAPFAPALNELMLKSLPPPILFLTTGSV